MADPLLLAQILRESGLKYAQNAKSYVFDCPRCKGKKKLYIRKKDGRFVCFFCREVDNYQGRVEFALSDLLGIPVKQLQGRLYSGEVQVKVFLDLPIRDFFGDDDEIDEDAKPLPLVSYPADYYPIDDEASWKGAKYMEGRGVPMVLARKYGLHYAPEKKRVVFPVESDGKLYGWQERLVVPNTWVDENDNVRETPKILSSPGIPRDRTLMFVDRLVGSEHAVLCEGPVDAIKAHACGGNVCAMGKAVSQEQVNLLLQSGVRKLYLALDPDAAAETERLVRDCYDYVELYEMVAPSKGRQKNDLGAMTFEEVYDLFLGASRVRAGHLFFFANPALA